MKRVYILAVLCVTITVTQAFVCESNFCDKVRCESVTEESCDAQNGVFEAKGGFCRCCPVCLVKIPKGEKCREFAQLLRGSPPTSACEPGTTCQSNEDGNVFTCEQG